MTITLGFSRNAHARLKILKDAGYFRELLDGYRFAIGLALARGVEPPEIQNRTTIFNVGTFDPDNSIKLAVEALMVEKIPNVSVNRIIERLAEWGVNELFSQHNTGNIDFVALLDEVSSQDS